MTLSIEERLAYMEAKMERLEKLEEQIQRTQSALHRVASTADKNFAIVSGRVSRKSEGTLFDMFGG